MTVAAFADTQRVAGASRFETATAISKAGWLAADTVVIATSHDFPDALAGGPLAYKENAPILLTRPDRLDPSTESEIRRLGAKKVIILGGAGAVSATVESKLKGMGLTVERIGGKTRFETAALIAKRLPSNRAVIAYSHNFPDVLSVSPYASRNGIPILLTRTDRLPAETKTALSGKTKVIVVGQTGAVSNEVMNQLPNPIRYGGKTRFDTGKAIITALPLGKDKAFIATGRNFPDALAGSVLAAKENAPILLVEQDEVPAATYSLISNYNAFTIYGSTGAVGENVRQVLDVTLENQ